MDTHVAAFPGSGTVRPCAPTPCGLAAGRSTSNISSPAACDARKRFENAVNTRLAQIYTRRGMAHQPDGCADQHPGRHSQPTRLGGRLGGWGASRSPEALRVPQFHGLGEQLNWFCVGWSRRAGLGARPVALLNTGRYVPCPAGLASRHPHTDIPAAATAGFWERPRAAALRLIHTTQNGV